MGLSYNRQCGTRYRAVMPINHYGPGDNYHPDNSRIIPDRNRTFHESKVASTPTVTVWGSGTLRRESRCDEERADPCAFLMSLSDAIYETLLDGDESESSKFESPLLNLGLGTDVPIRELPEIVSQVARYAREIVFESTKPVGTPRKLMNVLKLSVIGRKARTSLPTGPAAALIAGSNKLTKLIH